MPLVIADRVKETSTSTGNGNITLSGAATGYQSFNSAIGVNNNCYYTIENPSAGEWEVGIGTITSSTNLVRTFVLRSSNSNNRVTFTSGTKNVFVTLSADQITSLAQQIPGYGGTGTTNPGLMVNDGNVNFANTQIFAWGSNAYGVNNDGTIVAKSSPVQTLSNNWIAVAGGYGHAVALRNDNTLWTIGNNARGNLGDNTIVSRSSPVQTVAGSQWIAVAAGGDHCMGIRYDNTLWSWGLNTSGQLGDNTVVNKSSPVQILGGDSWNEISAFESTSAGIKRDGTLWLWGSNSYGQLGNNSITNRSSPVQTIAGASTWSQVSCGWRHTLALKTDGTLWAWGSNTNGQLGDNTVASKSSPVQTVAGGNNWIQISAGRAFSTALKSDGTLWTWGYNGFYGNLGDNTTVDRSSPVQTVTGGYNWVSVSAGYFTVAAVKSDGSLWTFGQNNFGQMGDNSTVTKSSPVQVITSGVYSSAVGRNFAYAFNRQQKAFNLNFAMNGSTVLTLPQGGYLLSDVDPAGIYNKILGSNTTWSGLPPLGTYGGTGNTNPAASIIHDGSINNVNNALMFAWGRNSYGQLGDNSIANRSSPVQVLGSNWITVSNYGASVSIKSDGTLWTWGANNSGQLGDNTVVNKSSPVQTVAGGNNWVLASAGAVLSGTVGAIKSDGTLWMWGANTLGALGDNSNVTARSSPVQTVAGGTNWCDVKIGTAGTVVALKTDGTLWTWGQNSFGNLGDNTVANRSSPVQTIAGGTNWTKIACDGRTVSALKSDGTLWSWGIGTSGQLGDNAAVSRSSPVQTVAGGNNWVAVTQGTQTSGGLKSDGTLWIWGSNGYGQIGDNTIISRSSPVQTIAYGNTWTSLNVGNGHTIAGKSDGSVWLWGNNTYGQLGDNTRTNRSSPVQIIASGSNFNVSASGNSSYVIVRQSKAFPFYMQLTGPTVLTMPQGGTLATLAGTETLSAKTISLAAGNTTTGPLRFASGTNMTTATSGNMEFDGTRLYFTPTTTRQAVAFVSDITGGLTIADDTTTNATRYLMFTSATSGSASAANVSSTKLYFNPNTGDLTAGGNITSLSDIRLKSNITTINDALSKVLKLRGVEFDWIDTNQHSIGVIAQELEEVVPEFVQQNHDYKSVSYGHITALLIEAIKQQNARISKLEGGK